MPKRPRQAHIPSSQIRRRKPTRRPVDGNGAALEPAFADTPAFVPPSSGSGPIDTRPRRRLEMLQRAEPQVRVVPGQLPTFEKGYLKHELRQITLTAGSLLALIIVLAVVLR